MALNNDDIYLFGGYSNSYLNDLWSFSLKNNTWKEIKTLNSPEKRVICFNF
jgi:hypothetical protein